jgi:hypothetical protein
MGWSLTVMMTGLAFVCAATGIATQAASMTAHTTGVFIQSSFTAFTEGEICGKTNDGLQSVNSFAPSSVSLP